MGNPTPPKQTLILLDTDQEFESWSLRTHDSSAPATSLIVESNHSKLNVIGRMQIDAVMVLFLSSILAFEHPRTKSQKYCILRYVTTVDWYGPLAPRFDHNDRQFDLFE